MTTIAFNEEVMVSDSQMTTGNHIEPEPMKKIYRAAGYLCGYCGVSDMAEQVFDWLDSGGDVAKAPTSKDYYEVVRHNGGKKFEIYFNKGNGWLKKSCPGAIGSGEYYALAAMMAGATPKEAVKIASKLDVATGGKIVERPL